MEVRVDSSHQHHQHITVYVAQRKASAHYADTTAMTLLNCYDTILRI